MSKKAEFVEFVENLMTETHTEMSEGVQLYWDAFRGTTSDERPMFTENGKLILQFMKDNQSVPMWKSKDIAEGLFISSRAVSGAMRKLVTDEFVEKVGQDPVIYTLTQKGKEIEISE